MMNPLELLEGTTHPRGEVGMLGLRPLDRLRMSIPGALLGLVLRLVIFVGAQVGLLWALETQVGPMELVLSPWLVGGEILYVFGATLLDPRPVMSNVGWGGTMLDNPFRISDDVNRSLLFLAIFFSVFGGPGRFVGMGFVHLFSAILGAADRPSSLPEVRRPAEPPPARPIERRAPERRRSGR